MPQSTTRILRLGILFVLVGFGSCAGRDSQEEEAAAFESEAVIASDYPLGSASLLMINTSADSIVGVYMHPSDRTDRGPNLLSNRTIPVGGSATMKGMGGGVWDITIQDAQGLVRVYPHQHLDDAHAYSLIIDAYGWQ